MGWNGAGLPPPPPLAPRRIRELLRAAVDLYLGHWRTFLRIVAVVVVPLTLLQYLLSELAVRGVRVRGEEVEVTAGAWRALAASGILAIFSLLITQVLIGALAWAVAGAVVGREPTVEESYRFGLARLWSILWVGVLVGLAAFAGFILLVIPGIFVLVRLSVAIPALVVERRRGGEALSRSWSLVRGHGWRVLGTFVTVFALTGIVTGIFTAPASGSGWLLRAVLAAVGQVITTPFTAIVTLLVYLDLRARAEGLDLETLARELEAARP
ncbi:MAG TPA: hypothetical protein VNP94_08880 [Actinomycetota bacterium]|nr:hypothetical protein [Actinomycetota bacterium]